MMNLIQGSLWKEKAPSDDNNFVFSLILYADDYENNNPIGSHKGLAKSGSVYPSILCLPPKYQSKLENIILFVLFNTLDRTAIKNKIIQIKIIDELKYLQNEGIEIQFGNRKKIYFTLALLVGDNLGLHQLLGLIEGFKGNYFCRFCLFHKKDKHDVLKEIIC